MRVHLMGLVLAGVSLFAGPDISRLPDWAARAVRAAAGDQEPADADAWVLLDRTEIAYVGGGEIRERHFRVVKVLGERGISQRTYVLRGLGGKSAKVKKLKGWNLRPDDELEKLDSDNVVTMNDAGDAEFSTETLTGAVLMRVVKGSYVVFESLEAIVSPLGPVSGGYLMESVPIRCWEFDVAKQEGWFTNLKAVEVKVQRNHFSPWIAQVESLGSTGTRVSGLPALPKDEGGHPHLSNVLPNIQVRFLDPDIPGARTWQTWDDTARWIDGLYRPAVAPSGLPEFKARKGAEGLADVWAWMGRSLTYKAVYLTPDRGWVPEQASEVGRKRYGDCKDLSAFFMAQARALGFGVAPVLARIQAGSIEAQQEPFPVFNHVISAVRLEASLGLSAEVATPRGRFLLADPTDPFTPLGKLGSGHRGKRVMICLPEGAEWVVIPDQAILADSAHLALEGEVQGSQLTGVLRFQETGSYWGLRHLAHGGGAKAIRDNLMARWLDMPANAKLEVTKVGDPLDLEHPFECEVKVTHPDGFHRSGGEWTLVGWGIPPAPGLIQKVGAPRLYPVSASRQGELHYHALLTIPSAVEPLLRDRAGDNAFRTFHWKAEARPEAGKTRLDLSLDHAYKPAEFGFEARDKGLQAWKQDRSLMKSLHEDGLAFKAVGP